MVVTELRVSPKPSPNISPQSSPESRVQVLHLPCSYIVSDPYCLLYYGIFFPAHMACQLLDRLKKKISDQYWLMVSGDMDPCMMFRSKTGYMCVLQVTRSSCFLFVRLSTMSVVNHVWMLFVNLDIWCRHGWCICMSCLRLLFCFLVSHA